MHLRKKKILFYTANGVGLGHLRRTTLIAEAMRKLRPDLDIRFITMASDVSLLKKKKFSYQQLECLTDEMLKNRCVKEIKASNEHRIAGYLQKQKPDILIADVRPGGFSFSNALLLHRFDDIDKVFIYRLGDKENSVHFFTREKDMIARFDMIAIPHALTDLERILGKRLCSRIAKDERFAVTGPIVGRASQDGLKKCRKKYGISKDDLVITITFGGGGGHAGKCESPDHIIVSLLDALPSLKRKIPSAKVIMVTGPFSKLGHKSLFRRGVQIVKYEENLLELMSLSSLVIASVGYNTCNELILARTPAVLVPLLRGDKEQFERARYLQSTGTSVILKRYTPEEIIKKVMCCINHLGEMKDAFGGFDVRGDGARKIARLILSKF